MCSPATRPISASDVVSATGGILRIIVPPISPPAPARSRVTAARGDSSVRSWSGVTSTPFSSSNTERWRSLANVSSTSLPSYRANRTNSGWLSIHRSCNFAIGRSASWEMFSYSIPEGSALRGTTTSYLKRVCASEVARPCRTAATRPRTTSCRRCRRWYVKTGHGSIRVHPKGLSILPSATGARSPRVRRTGLTSRRCWPRGRSGAAPSSGRNPGTTSTR